jgi:hypothetical protein
MAGTRDGWTAAAATERFWWQIIMGEKFRRGAGAGRGAYARMASLDVNWADL